MTPQRERSQRSPERRQSGFRVAEPELEHSERRVEERVVAEPLAELVPLVNQLTAAVGLGPVGGTPRQVAQCLLALHQTPVASSDLQLLGRGRRGRANPAGDELDGEQLGERQRQLGDVAGGAGFARCNDR